MDCISIIIINPPSQSGQVIESPTHIREIFQDVEEASSVFAESPQFDQDTTKSLMEVVVKMIMCRKVLFQILQNGLHIISAR